MGALVVGLVHYQRRPATCVGEEAFRGTISVEDVDLTQRLVGADTITAAHSACTEMARSLGFSQFLFGLRLPVPIDHPRQLVLSGYSPTWRARYDEQRYMLTDPVLQRSMSSTLAVEWDRIERDDPRTEQMFAEAAEMGLKHGMTMPVHGARGEFSLLSLAGPDPLPVAPRARMELARRAQWFAFHLHESVRRISSQPIAPRRGQLPTQLSGRERECLRMAAEGLSAAEIAERLNIAERTVVFHFSRCQEKLRVGSRQQAVARAVALGEIQPQCYPDQLVQSVQLVEPQ